MTEVTEVTVTPCTSRAWPAREGLGLPELAAYLGSRCPHTSWVPGDLAASGCRPTAARSLCTPEGMTPFQSPG